MLTGIIRWLALYTLLSQTGKASFAFRPETRSKILQAPGRPSFNHQMQTILIVTKPTLAINQA
jgi:hypothetical protein